jgi:hypothetical protein
MANEALHHAADLPSGFHRVPPQSGSSSLCGGAILGYGTVSAEQVIIIEPPSLFRDRLLQRLTQHRNIAQHLQLFIGTRADGVSMSTVLPSRVTLPSTTARLLCIFPAFR